MDTPAIFLERDLQELFYDLHESHLFTDGKMISDAVLLADPVDVVHAYRAAKADAGFDLRMFFEKYFIHAASDSTGFQSDKSKSIVQHIESLWPVLTRTPDGGQDRSSRIALPYPYIVPGGRFNEIYYWDSYFTMLGLVVSGRVDMVQHMVDNFAHMLSVYGLIPNGNRTYYLGRSQPPYFSSMVQLLADERGDEGMLVQYLPVLKMEYDFWMLGSQELVTDGASSRVVKCQGHLLNRYYDSIKAPRTEMYMDDMEVIEKGGQQLVTDIRAACESGWDFSARWLADPLQLDTIRTTQILPVDLNCLLLHLEETLAKASALAGDTVEADRYQSVARARRVAIDEVFWSATAGAYLDVDIETGQHTAVLSLATVYPLYFGVASQEQALQVAARVAAELLCAGGLVSTAISSGQQWDSPNGWAPLQWLAYRGLSRYGLTELAQQIKSRWMYTCERVYGTTGKMMEKYNVIDTGLPSGGGEYPVQDGFGWTNGVYLALHSDDH